MDNSIQLSVWLAQLVYLTLISHIFNGCTEHVVKQ